MTMTPATASSFTPPPAPLAHARLDLLGGWRLTLAGTVSAGPGYRKAWALLAFLVLEPGRHSRERLAELLGIESPGHLRQLLSRLRSTLELAGAPAPLCIERNLVGLAPDYPLSCDVVELLDKPQDILPLAGLEARLALYAGEFLHGLNLSACPEFESWLAIRREQLRQRAVHLLQTLRQAREVRGDLPEALALAQRLIELDPWNESGHRDVMRLLAASGQTAAALVHYAHCERSLHDTLGVAPSGETQALYQQLRAGMPLTVPAPPVSPSSLPEKRLVTVLCLELGALLWPATAPAGAAATVTTDVESLTEALQPFRRDCQRLLHEAGAWCLPEQGGRLLAYFGYPVARENAARQAVGCALAIAGLAREHGLTVGLGAHTGLVLSEQGGPTPDVAGLTTGGAVRLAGSAVGKGCRLSQATATLVRGFFALQAEDGGAADTEGAAERRVWSVLGPTGKAHRLDAVGSLYPLPPLIGREGELALLRRLWDALANRDAASPTASPTAFSCLIEGEAGIGKSRLLRSLSDDVEQGGGRVLTLYCLPEFAQTPFQPLLSLLARVSRVAEVAAADGAGRLAALARFLDRHPAPQLSPPLALALLGDALGLPVAEDSLKDLAPPRRQELLSTLLLALLRGLAAAQPLLLLVEDLHWSDPSTLDLLVGHARHSPQAPLLTVLTTRPHCAGASRLHALTPRVVLAPLGSEEVSRLVLAIAGTLPPATVARIVACAEGVPLFAEEMARMAGHAPEDAGSVSSAPLTLQELLAARLDACGSARGTAQLAASIGRDFSWTLLQRASPLPAVGLGQELVALEAAGLIRVTGPRCYQFRHALIQEAAYASQTRAARMSTHRRLAEVLQMSDEGEATPPEILAHHLTEAGEPLAALPWWRAAGRNAARQSASREAESLYRRALSLLPEALTELPAATQADWLREAFHLHAALGSVRLALFGYGSAEARQAFAQAVTLSDQLETVYRRLGASAALEEERQRALFPVLFGLWHGGGEGAATVAPLALAERLARLADASGDPAQRLVADYAFSHNYFWLARYADARRHQEAATRNPHRVSSDSLIALCGEDSALLSASFLAWTLCFQGEPAQAQRVMAETVAAARQAGHTHTLCYVLIFAGVLTRHLLQPEATLAYAREVAELAERHSLSLWQAAANALTGWALGMLGDPAGMDYMRRGVELCRGAMHLIESTFRSYLVEVLYRQGQYAEAIIEAEGAIAVAEACRDCYLLPEFHRMRAMSLLATAPDRRPEALAGLHASRQLAREQGNLWFELRSLSDLRVAEADNPDWPQELAAVLAVVLREHPANATLTDLQQAQAALTAPA